MARALRPGRPERGVMRREYVANVMRVDENAGGAAERPASCKGSITRVHRRLLYRLGGGKALKKAAIFSMSASVSGLAMAVIVSSVRASPSR